MRRARLLPCIFTMMLLAFLASCAAIPTKPEVFLPSVPKKEVMNAIVAAMVQDGYDLKGASDYHLVFGKRVTDYGSRMLFGSRWDSTPELRVQYTLAERMDTGLDRRLTTIRTGQTSGVHVTANVQLVTNPGTGFERVTDWNGSQEARELEQLFQRTRLDLLSSIPYPAFQGQTYGLTDGEYGGRVGLTRTVGSSAPQESTTRRPLEQTTVSGSSMQCDDAEIRSRCPFFRVGEGFYRARCQDGSRVEVTTGPNAALQVGVIPPSTDRPQPWEAQRCTLASLKAN